MDDSELIAAVASGDDAALRELFSRHAPWLSARLRVVLPPADVEDVLQETFLAVWRGARGWRREGTAGGWLWGIARRQAALWLRHRGPTGLVLPALAAAGGRFVTDPAEAVAAAVTFGWLVPMTAVCALALAAATVARSANAGMAAGVAGWMIAVLSGRVAAGRLTAVVTGSFLVIPYLAAAACCCAVAWYATRSPKGTS